MPLPIAPLVIFAIILTGLIVAALITIHIWRARVDRRKEVGIELSTPHDSFVGSELHWSPGRSAHGGGATAIGLPRAPGRIRGGDADAAGGQDGARDGALSVISEGAESRVTGGGGYGRGDGVFGAGGGIRGSSLYSQSTHRGAGVSVHYGDDLGDRYPHPCYSGNSDAQLNRFGVTVTTVPDVDLDTRSVIGNDEEDGRGRKASGASSKGSFRRSMSRLSEARSEDRMRESVGTLEVHPWRLSYT
ncbi:hypothetical protein UCRNP2_622 [Neofusicoccum parvum UCRNP2]|uniref:Uncharacterized protein n=1 Tax=Botryosphaeria parva (strain UCR-NP2) TaxID=1287680 RepID=R1H2G2_BOTPV|nr:hypothetical protein UCRNP2_622 [Neofusicoccum parvum UCRNP2]